MKNTITLKKIAHYTDLTERALAEIKKNIVKGKEKEAKKIIEMVENYLSDSKHFKSKKDLVNSFGAIYYAYGWIDCGARLKIFDVNDDQMFTI